LFADKTVLHNFQEKSLDFVLKISVSAKNVRCRKSANSTFRAELATLGMGAREERRRKSQRDAALRLPFSLFFFIHSHCMCHVMMSNRRFREMTSYPKLKSSSK